MDTESIPRSASKKGSPELFTVIAVAVGGDVLPQCVRYNCTEGWGDAINEQGTITRHHGEVVVVVRDLEREALEVRIQKELLNIAGLEAELAAHTEELALARTRLEEYEALANAEPDTDADGTQSGTNSGDCDTASHGVEGATSETGNAGEQTQQHGDADHAQ